MAELKIIRASAGSGKTFVLTADYLKLVFRNSSSYRNILAITFTNKATAEMKNRIIGELVKLSKGEHSGYFSIISEANHLNGDQIKERASEILNLLLHNYSRFSVSTIDSFFQRIIHAFAREAGLQASFEVQLDVEEVLQESVEQLLMNISGDKQLIEWLSRFAESKIEDGKSWDIAKDMIQLGKELFTENFRLFPKEYHQKLADKEVLKKYHNRLFAIKAGFEKKLKEAGKKASEIMQRYNLTADDFKYGAKGGSVGAYFIKLAKGDFREPGKRIAGHS